MRNVSLWRALLGVDKRTVRVWLEADAPRVNCPEHGPTVVAVPWARHGVGHAPQVPLPAGHRHNGGGNRRGVPSNRVLVNLLIAACFGNDV